MGRVKAKPKGRTRNTPTKVTPTVPVVVKAIHLFCPACGANAPPEPLIGTLTVCQTCVRSLVIEHGTCRVATADDLRGLTAAQVKELRLARPDTWRKDVRARHAQILAKKATA